MFDIPHLLLQHPVLGALTLISEAFLVFVLLRSFWTIGPTEVGLVRKRFGSSLKNDGPVAFRGEAG